MHCPPRLAGSADLRFHLALIASGFRESRHFQLNAFVSIFDKAIRLFILYYFFRAILDSSREFEQTMRYLFAATLVEAAVGMDLIEQMGQRIVTGEATYWLIRPRRAVGTLYSYSLGANLISIAAGVLLLVIAYPLWIGALSLPAAVWFLSSLSLAYCLAFALQFLFGLLIFRTLNSWGASMLHQTLFYLLAGVMFPVGLLPGPLATITRALPFHHVVATPVRVLLGQATCGDALLQIVWLLALGTLISRILKHHQHRFLNVGG